MFPSPTPLARAHFQWRPAALLFAASALALASACPPRPPAAVRERLSAAAFAVKKDSVASVKAFQGVYQVLMSPRCLNCHPAGDRPLQGEDSHVHAMNVRRGADGKGISALRCANCHQDKNLPGLHMPPGNPQWGLPPARMKMVFQGRTPRQLARQLLDLRQNGGKTRQQLLAHVASDSLVLGGWHPGDGRALPPLSHAAFARLFTQWLATGAYAPSR